ncbi:MAG: APC family permease [Oscillospiraceae bacterium]
MPSLKDILLGKPLKNSDLAHEKLSRTWGLPIMSSDAVSSVAYSIEEILIILVPAIGLAAFRMVPLVVIPILLLLGILVVSYMQIIDHYPKGGGAYVVTKQNLGKTASLVTAAALVIDYIMTVAVSLSSSSAAIISAFPKFADKRMWIALLALMVITFFNLRGTHDASKIFGVPTYVFILSMVTLIVTGLIKAATGNLHEITYTEKIIPDDLSNGIGILLILKAFSTGCSAMTGIEAVSDAVPSFKAPAVRNAKHILMMLGVIILFIFGGTSILAIKLQVLPTETHTVLSQIAGAVFGHGFMYYVLQIFTALILLLAANTAFNGLPHLFYILAHDGYIPRQFSQRGTKLSFSNGIIFITVVAGALIAIYQANVNKLIALYSVGVFISFTIAQASMFKRWHKTREKGWQYKMWINGVGAIVTTLVSCIVLVTKFLDGAWLLVIAMPAIMGFMYLIHKHYTFVGKQLTLREFKPLYKSEEVRKTQVVMLVHDINKPFLKALNYATSISTDIQALHICRHPEHAEALRKKWDHLEIPIELKIILTPYRDIIEPLDDYLWERERALKHGENISVILVKFITEHWVDNILHNQTTYFLERHLNEHKNIASVIVPFHYKFDRSRLKDPNKPVRKRTAKKKPAAKKPAPAAKQIVGETAPHPAPPPETPAAGDQQNS